MYEIAPGAPVQVNIAVVFVTELGITVSDVAAAGAVITLGVANDVPPVPVAPIDVTVNVYEVFAVKPLKIPPGVLNVCVRLMLGIPVVVAVVE